MTKGNKKTCISLLNSLSIAFYNDDVKYRDSIYKMINVYELLYGVNSIVAETMMFVNYISNDGQR